MSVCTLLMGIYTDLYYIPIQDLPLQVFTSSGKTLKKKEVNIQSLLLCVWLFLMYIYFSFW